MEALNSAYKENNDLYDLSRRFKIPIKTIRDHLEHTKLNTYHLAKFCTENMGKTIFLFDLETSGLPATIKFNQYYPYTSNMHYDSSRILQISYCIFHIGDPTPPTFITSFRKPEGFDISPKSSEIHGLKNEFLEKFGVPFRTIVDSGILTDIEKCDYVMSHNTDFDINILCNELYRINCKIPRQLLDPKNIVCSCKLTNYTKLKTLYESTVSDSETEVRFHDATEDVRALYKIIQTLLSNNK
jgi:DNA polymerase III epsilon subunit-like protein